MTPSAARGLEVAALMQPGPISRHVRPTPLHAAMLEKRSVQRGGHPLHGGPRAHRGARRPALPRVAPVRTDIEPEGVPAEMPFAVIRIESLDDYERATARVAQIAGEPDVRRHAAELKALTDAIMEWDRSPFRLRLGRESSMMSRRL